MEVPELRLGRHRIDLAHVPSLVLLLHVVYVQIPRPVLVMLVVGHTDPGIPRDDVVVYGQDGALLKVHPGDLPMVGCGREENSRSLALH